MKMRHTNLQIHHLQNEVLQIDLSHISPKRVLQGCVLDVANLTEIIAALVCLEWKPDLPDAAAQSQHTLHRISNDVIGEHGLHDGPLRQSQQGHTHLIHNPREPERPPTRDPASSQCLTWPAHPVLSARDCTNPPLQHRTCPQKAKADVLAHAPKPPECDLDGSVSEGLSSGSGNWATNSASEVSAVHPAVAASSHSWCSKRSSKGTETIDHQSHAFRTRPSVPLGGLHDGSTTNVLQDYSSTTIMHTAAAQTPHDCPAQTRSSYQGYQLVQERVEHGENHQMYVGSTHARRYGDGCIQLVEAQQCDASDDGFGQLNSRSTEVGVGDAVTQTRCWNGSLERHSVRSAPWRLSSSIDQDSAWRKPAMARPSGVASTKSGQHPTDLKCRPHVPSTTAQVSEFVPSHATSLASNTVSHAAPSTRNTNKASLNHRQTLVEGNVQTSIESNSVSEAPSQPPQRCRAKTHVAAVHVCERKSMDMLNDEDDTVLAAVIQDLLQDEPVELSRPDNFPGTAVPASAEPDIKTGGIVDQDGSSPAAEVPPFPNAFERHTSSSSAAPGSTHHHVLPKSTGDDILADPWRRTSSKESASSTTTSADVRRAASVECRDQFMDLGCNFQFECEDVRHTSRNSCQSGTTGPPKLGEASKASGTSHRKKRSKSLHGARKSMMGSSDFGRRCPSDKDKELPCSHPWLPNGKSGVGLVSTAVSPIRKHKHGAKQRKRNKGQQRKRQTASNAIPKAYLTDVHPIAGVRAGGGPSNQLAGRSYASRRERSAKGRLETTLACKLAYVMKLKQGSPVTQARQARIATLAEKQTVSRAEAQQRLEEKLARAQQIRESIQEGKRETLQEKAKRHSQTVHVHKATMVLQEAVSVLEKTRQEQAVTEQKYFREAFLQAVEAEKEALLEMRRDSQQLGRSACSTRAALTPRCCNTGNGSVMECMKSKISSLQDELKAMQHDQKENQCAELRSAMDHLSLQLQNLYTDAKNARKGQKDRASLVANIRTLVQDTIYDA